MITLVSTSWDEVCVRCKKRDRGGSFRVCSVCYSLSIREANLKSRWDERIAKPKWMYYPEQKRPRCRLGRGIWDNAVKAIEDRR